MTDQVLVVINPRTGRHRFRRQVPALCRALVGYGIQPQLQVASSPEHLIQCVRGVRGMKAVVVVGGDGTWHTAIQGLAGSDQSAALLPVGTGNDNARSLGQARGAPDELARAIAFDQARMISLGRATLSDGRTEWFSGILTAGFDSAVNARANDLNVPGATTRYVAALLSELPRYGPSHYRIDVDGSIWEGDAVIASVGNSAYYGGGMKMCPHANIFRPYLAVTIVEYVPLVTFAKAFPSLYRGTHVNRPHVHTMSGVEVSIEAPGHQVFADGEHLGSTPVSVTTEPDALRVFSTGTGDEAHSLDHS